MASVDAQASGRVFTIAAPPSGLAASRPRRPAHALAV